MKYKFYKKKVNRWYISLPEYEGLEEELEMVSGADTMLNIIAEGKNIVELHLSLKEGVGSTEVKFVKSNSPDEGGYYFLKTYQNIDYNLDIWLCPVTLFVFGNYPKKIFIRKV